MKKVGLFLGMALFCLGGYLVYLFEFKDYDVADAEVDDITNEEYVIELSDGSKIILDEFGNLIRKDEPVASSGDNMDDFNLFKPREFMVDVFAAKMAPTKKIEVVAVANQKTAPVEKAKASGAKSTTNSSTNSTSLKHIKQKYQSAMVDIEVQSKARIYDLIDVAKEEFHGKETKNKTISYPYFYNKYTAAAADLEKRTDQIFYALLEAMKQDLKANGYSESTADSYAQEYEKRKNKLRNELLKKAAGI
ncbi:hypothetical protein [Planococcus sp. YIM B11945]|uniref:hypothetical protein n=1 Tax=Planococcus sp. YIM B11945 TaxID=3435410 RepID=UPI003D7CA6E9